jgi:hypothetical protein
MFTGWIASVNAAIANAAAASTTVTLSAAATVTANFADVVAGYVDIPLLCSITKVQPMTGIVFFLSSTYKNTDAIQLEFSYILPNDVVTAASTYDWSSLDATLDDIASRGHQAVLRFRYTYPGMVTAVPDYIKALPGYEETVHTTAEYGTTSYPDWRHAELQRFTLEFFTEFAARYDADPRVAFLQTGFGHWAEYHIDGAPLVLGTTFPSKAFQAEYYQKMDDVFDHLPWSMGISSADSTYSPLSVQPELLNIHWGLFDDSFMHEEHDQWNELLWNFFGADHYTHSPHGGEFSYFSLYDQQNVLNAEGIYGRTYEGESAKFHISYMFGNDQPLYQPMSRIREAGMANGYKFHVNSFRASQDSSLVEVTNRGVAPIYHDAYLAVNGTRAAESLRGLLPGQTLLCQINAGGTNPVLTIESDRLVPGQVIEYSAGNHAPTVAIALSTPIAAVGETVTATLTLGDSDAGDVLVPALTINGIDVTAGLVGSGKVYTYNYTTTGTGPVLFVAQVSDGALDASASATLNVTADGTTGNLLYTSAVFPTANDINTNTNYASFLVPVTAGERAAGRVAVIVRGYATGDTLAMRKHTGNPDSDYHGTQDALSYALLTDAYNYAVSGGLWYVGPLVSGDPNLIEFAVPASAGEYWLHLGSPIFAYGGGGSNYYFTVEKANQAPTVTLTLSAYVAAPGETVTATIDVLDPEEEPVVPSLMVAGIDVSAGLSGSGGTYTYSYTVVAGYRFLFVAQASVGMLLGSD